MYENAFHFSSRPFTPMPYVKHYFPGHSIHQSLAHCRLCIDRSSGPVVVVGTPGSGKSLLLQLLQAEYQSQYSVVLLDCARLAERRDLLLNILFELEQPYRHMDEGELRLALLDFLRPGKHCPNGVLLLVDDADAMPLDLLDEVRLITNLVRDGEPRIRLVMAGNQRLEEHLMRPSLESFQQRIAARCYLSSLNRAETREYIAAHIERAGGIPEEIYSEESFREIHAITEGCPRVINQLCEHALIMAATNGVRRMDAPLIQMAWRSLQNMPVETAAPASVPAGGHAAKPDSGVLEFGELDDECSDDGSWDDGTPQEFASGSGDLETGNQQPGSLEDRDDAHPRSTGTPAPPVPAEPSPDDPLDEPYAVEEMVVDPFMPIFIQQNINSLTVTREDLERLDALLNDAGQTPSGGSSPVAWNQPHTETSAIPFRMPAQPESNAPRAEQAEPPRQAPFCHPAAEPAALYSSHSREEPRDGENGDFVGYPSQVNIDQAYIEEQADAVLRSLGSLDEEQAGEGPISRDSFQAEPLRLSDANDLRMLEARTSSNLDVYSAFMDVDALTESTNFNSELTNRTPPASAVPEFSAEPAAEGTPDELELLRDVHRQIGSLQRMAAEASDGDAQEDHESIPFEGARIPSPRENPQDDRDMLIVEGQDRNSQSESHRSDPEFSQPRRPSTGRAIRVDYEQLFEQLRREADEEDPV